MDDIIWAAGFFDGEGCISLSKCYKDNYLLRVTVAQRIIEPLQLLQALFGGQICVHDGRGNKNSLRRTTGWQWYVTGNRAKLPLESLQPHLKIKAREAELALEYLDLRPGRSSGRYTDEARVRIEQIADECRKRKGH